jgi:hypothetical protein
MSGTRAFSTTSRREMSSRFFFLLQGKVLFLFSVALQPNAGHGFLILEVS